jgi:hypothetical protein
MAMHRVWSEEEKQWLKDNLRYDEETGNLFWKHPRQRVCIDKPAGYNRPDGYVQVGTTLSNKDRKVVLYLAHKVIWFLQYGEQPEFLDHIDNNPANNKIENLRVATSQGNMLNRKPWGNITYKGVYPSGKRYKSVIKEGDSLLYLGTFDTQEGAARAFDKKVEEHKRRFPELSTYYVTNKDLGLL